VSSCRERSVTNPIAADGTAARTAAPSPTFTVVSELSEYRRRAGRAAIALLILTALLSKPAPGAAENLPELFRKVVPFVVVIRPKGRDAGRRRPDRPDIVGACEG
jgi:hypothetical protein